MHVVTDTRAPRDSTRRTPRQVAYLVLALWLVTRIIVLVVGMVPVQGWWRSLRRTVPPFLVAFAVPVVPALLLSVNGTVESVRYHVQRGVQIESLWANGIDLIHLVSGLPARTV